MKLGLGRMETPIEGSGFRVLGFEVRVGGVWKLLLKVLGLGF